MDALDDYNNLFFEGTWDFVKTMPCMQKRRVRGPSGEIKYTPPSDDDEVKKRELCTCMAAKNCRLKSFIAINLKGRKD